MTPSHALALLVCATYEDPSEILNLVDTVRAGIPTSSPLTRNHTESTCIRAELEIHSLYTPLEMAHEAARAAG